MPVLWSRVRAGAALGYGDMKQLWDFNRRLLKSYLFFLIHFDMYAAEGAFCVWGRAVRGPARKGGAVCGEHSCAWRYGRQLRD